MPTQIRRQRFKTPCMHIALLICGSLLELRPASGLEYVESHVPDVLALFSDGPCKRVVMPVYRLNNRLNGYKLTLTPG